MKISKYFSYMIIICLTSAGFFSFFKKQNKQMSNQKKLFITNIIGVNDFYKKLEEAAKEDKTTIVKFYADWCPACREIDPIFQKIAISYNKNNMFLEVNVDNAQKLSKLFAISGIPHTLFFKPDSSPNRKKADASLIGSDDYEDNVTKNIKLLSSK